MKAELVPRGWCCTLEECPPGHFMWGNIHDAVGFGFKSEYGMEGEPNRTMAFNEAGEFFCWPKTEIRQDSLVQPLELVIEDE